MKSRFLALALVFGLANFTATTVQAANPGAPNPADTFNIPPSSIETHEYAEIQKLFASQSYSEAVAKMEGYEERYSKSPLQMQIENLRGLCLIMTHHYAAAAGQFMSALQKCPDNSPFLPFLQYNLAKARFESDDIDGAETLLNQIASDKLDNGNRIKFHFLRAEVFAKRKALQDAAHEFLVAGQMMQLQPMTSAAQAATKSSGQSAVMSAEQRKLFETSLNNCLDDIKVPAQLEALVHDFPESPLLDSVLFHLGSLELSQDLNSKGEEDLRSIIASFPQSSYVPRAQALLSATVKNRPVEHSAVGVLLPLKGKFARWGQTSLAAIEQAFHVFDLPNSGSGAGRDFGVELVIQDSGETPDSAIKALDTLVNKYHVAAVIGPLLSKGIDQVTRRAEELGVPMISLARHTGTGGESYVIQGGLTIQSQAYEMAKYAILTRGLRRFAILYPKDKAGEDSANAFWDAVESLGGQIVGSEFYPPHETDFGQLVDKLSGLYYKDARLRELDALAKLRKLNDIKKRTRKTEKFFALPPIVDYEAVFIAGEPQEAGQIMPTFAYRDVDHVQFLGTSTWNTQELIQRSQKDAEGSLFVDAFFAGSEDFKIKRFVSDFNAQFGVTPTSTDAVAYESAIVLRDALANAGTSFSSAELLDRIRNMSGSDGLTGKITYKNGQLQRDLLLLSIKGGQIVEEIDKYLKDRAKKTSQETL